MNFLNLYYFRVAAEELSFTNAAKRLFISQQSLSNHISRLENEFGVIHFNRTKPITLTEAGKSLYASSKVLLHQKEQIEKSMQDIRDFRKGELTLGISTSRGAVMLPKILPEFRSAFPQIKLNLVEGTTKEINQALFEGRADLCIGFAINDPEKVHEELLHTESLVCVIPNSFLPTARLSKCRNRHGWAKCLKNVVKATTLNRKSSSRPPVCPPWFPSVLPESVPSCFPKSSSAAV